MLEDLKQQVYKANMDLCKYNLVIFTWGNVSGREGEYIAIKPSGVSYESMKPEDIVILDLEGKIIEGNYRPSSDTPTHLELYKHFPEIKGICHTHSTYATSFAQAGASINCFGTTHADYFYGPIQCTRSLTREETINDYEKNTGKVIIESLSSQEDKLGIPGILVRDHGVFSWGLSASESVHNAVVIEALAKMNLQTLQLNPQKQTIPQYILDKHYYRKHGKNAYYGQSQLPKEKV